MPGTTVRISWEDMGETVDGEVTFERPNGTVFKWDFFGPINLDGDGVEWSTAPKYIFSWEVNGVTFWAPLAGRVTQDERWIITLAIDRALNELIEEYIRELRDTAAVSASMRA